MPGWNSGNEFASFILGQVDSANFSAPFKYMPKMKYGSFWGNDDIKLLKNLNITLGLRVDIQGGLTEEYGRFSTFDPTALNPVGITGATMFHTSKANGDTEWNVGPRVGFAYSSIRRLSFAAVTACTMQAFRQTPGIHTLWMVIRPIQLRQTQRMGCRQHSISTGTGTCPATLTQLPSTAIPCTWPAGSIVLPPQLTG